MARIFKQHYTTKAPSGGRVTKQSRRWYVEYRDADGVRRRVRGFADKAATQQLAAELERNAERVESGLVDRFSELRKRRLTEHVSDWHDAIIGKGTTSKHADLIRNRAQRIFDGCRFIFWPDVSASKVQTYIAELRTDSEERRGISAQTSNFYVQAVKQFCRWMVQDGRAPDSPVAHLKGINVRTDRRHDRRQLTDDDLRGLLGAARNGPERYGMTGPARATLYQLAVESGLRASELRSLTWGSFDLDSNPPTVTVQAAYSKHRREDTLPLKSSTAQMLARWRDESGTADRRSPVFATMAEKSNIVKMLRADLTVAEIEYRDEAGRVADFHALRHTFITNLARTGVHPKVAQQLARHSTITLTMDRYSHLVIGELADGLSALPELDTGARDQERQRRTGTCDIAPMRLPRGLPKNLPSRVASQESPISSDCISTVSDTVPTQREDAGKIGFSCTSSHRVASHTGEGGIRTRETGVNPSDGLANRWFQPLTHLSTGISAQASARRFVWIGHCSCDLKRRGKRTETVAGPPARSTPTGDYSEKNPTGKPTKPVGKPLW